MNKMFKRLVVFVLSLCIFAGNINGVSAQEAVVPNNQHEVTEKVVNDVDQYVTVVDNQYVLELPDNYDIGSQELDLLKDKMDVINAYIANGNLKIDLDTKIASQTISTFKYGVNSISFSWNSIIFKLDAGMVELLAKAGAAGALAIVIATFPPLVAFVAANPVLGLAVGAIVVSVVDSIVGSGIINDGLEIHYNFLLFRVTVVRKQ